MFEELGRDMRHALRTLRRSPGFTAVMVVTLGLGIGANIALFSVMDQLLLRMLPVDRPDELVLLDGPGIYQGFTWNEQAFSLPMFRGLDEASEAVLSGMFARFSTSATVAGANDAQRASAELVSGDYFRTLGVRTVLGRALGPEDDLAPGSHPAIVLSHGYWQRRFGGSARVIGSEIRVNGHRMTIVGVAAAGFNGVELGAPADLFVPLMMYAELLPTWSGHDEWRTRWLNIMARLRPGVSAEQAAAALTMPYTQLVRRDVETARLSGEERERFLQKSLVVLPGGRGPGEFRDRFATPLLALMGMVGLVLLIVCANVASLLIARATTRQREAAIRLALGAGLHRVIRQRLTESLVLAFAGGVFGLLFAWWTASALIEVLPFGSPAGVLSSDPDLRVILFAIAMAMMTAVAFGLAPALHASRPALAATLKASAGNLAGGGSHARFRRSLVIAQVALSVLLLTGSGLFARSLSNLRGLNPGFVSTDLLQFSLDPALSGYPKDASIAYFRSLLGELNALPGVVSSSLASLPAMTERNRSRTVRVSGYQPAPDENMSPSMNEVGPGYFATLGIPLVEGREFRESDDADAPRVAIVNETMARYFWGGENPLGRRFGWAGSETGDEIEVIGVVRDSRFTSIPDDIPRFFYIPHTQAEALGRITVYVRYEPGTPGVAVSVRQAVQGLDAGLPVFGLMTMDAQIDSSLVVERLMAWLTTAFGALATLLAAVGLYGVISYVVSHRVNEVGVRMALGAGRAAVLWMILREALVLVVAGIVIGIPLALGAGRLVASQLFGVSAADPLVLGAATLTLATVAILASYLPARRATRVDPMVALRWE